MEATGETPESHPRDEDASYARMQEATLEERRRRYRETTMAERLESALELSELAEELRQGLRSA